MGFHKINRSQTAALKLVGGAGQVYSLRAGGLEPTEEMVPGEYVANCEGATLTKKGKNTIAVLEFRIVDGPHSGTAVRQWVSVPDVEGVVPVGCRYAKQCAIALGREIEPGDDLNPTVVFKQKTFRVAVGYRMTEKTGGTASPDHALRRKDAKDYLRVHKLIEIEELS